MGTKLKKSLSIKKTKITSTKLQLINPATYKDCNKTGNSLKKFDDLTTTELKQSFLESFSHVALLIKTDSKEIVASNKAGKDSGAIPGKKCYEAWAHLGQLCPWCQASKLWKTNKPVQCKSEINGRIFETHWGAISEDLFLYTTKDITEHKLAELEALTQKEELQIIFDSVPALIFYKDRKNNFIKVNKAMADISKLEINEIEGKSAFELYPENADKYWKDDLEVIESGIAKKNIVEPLVIDKETKWIQTDKIPYKDSQGNIVGIIGISGDITKFKKTNEDLSLTNKKLFNEHIALTKSQSALKEVLKTIETEQRENLKIVQSNINKTVLPNLRNLEKGASESQTNYISLIKNNLSQVTSPFISKLESCYTKLSPKELQICGMIKEGMSSKDIANHLNTSEGTVRNQRKSIRRKLGIKNETTNLTTYLRSEI